jgi:hypothetical protein
MCSRKQPKKEETSPPNPRVQGGLVFFAPAFHERDATKMILYSFTQTRYIKKQDVVLHDFLLGASLASKLDYFAGHEGPVQAPPMELFKRIEVTPQGYLYGSNSCNSY